MTATNNTHFKQYFNTEYIGAYSLPNGEDMTVTILSVSQEMVIGHGGKKDSRPVAKLKDNKPFVLNMTNCQSIARMYGPYTEGWAGHDITLYKSTTRVENEMEECLRIRRAVKTIQKQYIDTSRLLKAIDAIKYGKYSVEKLHKQFALTKEQSDLLTESLKSHEEFLNVEN